MWASLPPFGLLCLSSFVTLASDSNIRFYVSSVGSSIHMPLGAHLPSAPESDMSSPSERITFKRVMKRLISPPCLYVLLRGLPT